MVRGRVLPHFNAFFPRPLHLSLALFSRANGWPCFALTWEVKRALPVHRKRISRVGYLRAGCALTRVFAEGKTFGPLC